jgi:hypothetical protein
LEEFARLDASNFQFASRKITPNEQGEVKLDLIIRAVSIDNDSAVKTYEVVPFRYQSTPTSSIFEISQLIFDNAPDIGELGAGDQVLINFKSQEIDGENSVKVIGNLDKGGNDYSLSLNANSELKLAERIEAVKPT